MDLDKIRARWAKRRDPWLVILGLIGEIERLRDQLATARTELHAARMLLPVRVCHKCKQQRPEDKVAEVRPGQWMCEYGACPPPPVLMVTP